MLESKTIERYPELKEKVVLNVDDNEMNQLVISKILINAGVRTVVAHNGSEAIEKLNDGLKPDAILMDIEMPVMNGIQAPELIRKKINQDIPIIINSGLVSAYQKYRLNLLGIREYLEKPYSLDDILSKLAKNIVQFA